jgi:hypothetical protein
VAETLDSRIHACWINPSAQPQTTAIATPAAPPNPGNGGAPATVPGAPPSPAAPSPAPAK